ncbi:Signal peptidase complex-like protein [Drosera capensis]
MANDGPLRTSLVWLAVIILIVGISTYSFKKMMVTYFVGMLGIAGVLLPDWDYFDRDVSEWCQPITVEEIGPNAAQRPESHSSLNFAEAFLLWQSMGRWLQISWAWSTQALVPVKRLRKYCWTTGDMPSDSHFVCNVVFRFYPVRTVIYATVYGFGLYKWWTYITH